MGNRNKRGGLNFEIWEVASFSLIFLILMDIDKIELDIDSIIERLL